LASAKLPFTAFAMLAWRQKKSKAELLVLQQETQRVLKRCEDALRIGATVLGERGQEGRT
jgi:hypothetical protein